MIEQLQSAFEKAGRLSEEEQRSLAAILEEEMEDEREWARKFAASPNALAFLAEEAKAERAAGLMEPLEDLLH